MQVTTRFVLFLVLISTAILQQTTARRGGGGSRVGSSSSSSGSSTRTSISGSSTGTSIRGSSTGNSIRGSGYSSVSNKGGSSYSTPRTVNNIATTYLAHKAARNTHLKYSHGRANYAYPGLLHYRSNGRRPVFVGRYNQYNNSGIKNLKCYTCNGKGNDSCASMSSKTNSSSIIKQSTCAPNQYCAVIRKESYDPNQLEFEVSVSQIPGSPHNMTEKKCISYAKESHSKHDNETHKERTLFLQKVKAEGCEFRERPNNNETVIERVCKSVSTDVMGISPNSDSLRSNKSPVKIYNNSYCATELCNTGDGRLKCYACEGSGRDDPCMLGKINDTTSINIVTCEPNEFCHILRTVTLINATIDSNATTEWNIKRSCNAYSETDDDFQLNDGDEIIGGIATLACASDLCNSMDVNLLSVQPQELINSATISGTPFSMIALIASLTILFQINSYYCC